MPFSLLLGFIRETQKTKGKRVLLGNLGKNLTVGVVLPELPPLTIADSLHTLNPKPVEANNPKSESLNP